MKPAPAPKASRLDVADAGDDKFNLTIRRGAVEEKYEGVSLSGAKSAQNVVETVNKQSKLVMLEELKVAGAVLADRAPAPGTYAVVPAEAQALSVKTTSPDLYQGNVADRSGLGGFEAIDDITMVACPDVMAAYEAGALNREGVKAVQLALIAHCENMKDRVAIIDPLPDMSAQEVKDWRMKEAGYDSKYAALYYPWIQVANPNPSTNGTSMFIPPSGHMAGIWARSDTERGVHKAPANEVIRGVLGLQNNITKSEQDSLNPVGVNCIRAFPGRGIRVWGARTLSSDPSWRYINVRRLFNFVEESIMRGTQWVVFEPNDQALWQRVRRTINGFLTRVWRDGALFGTTPERGLLRQVRRREQPARNARRGPIDRRDRHLAGEAGRVRHLPHQPVQRRRRCRRVISNGIIKGRRSYQLPITLEQTTSEIKESLCQPVLAPIRLSDIIFMSRSTASRRRSSANAAGWTRKTKSWNTRKPAPADRPSSASSRAR